MMLHRGYDFITFMYYVEIPNKVIFFLCHVGSHKYFFPWLNFKLYALHMYILKEVTSFVRLNQLMDTVETVLCKRHSKKTIKK